MKLVVDTNILIDHLRGGKIWRKIADEIDDDTGLFVPTVVIFELFSGISTRNPLIVSQIYKLLGNFQRLDLNELIARQAGELYRDTKKTLEVPDYIIAASALSVNAQIVTLNQKHFTQIPGINLYPLS